MSLNLYTVTCSKHTPESFTALLLSEGITDLWDTRWTTSSQFRPEFCKSRMKALVESVGIRYTHHRVLGVPGAERDRLRALPNGEGRAAYLALITRQGANLEHLKGALQSKAALLCACAKGAPCHRLLLAELLGGGCEL